MKHVDSQINVLAMQKEEFKSMGVKDKKAKKKIVMH